MTDLPLMVGSKYSQRGSHGPQGHGMVEPGGYFIIDGSEKFIVNQYVLKKNNPMVLETEKNKFYTPLA